MNIEVFQDTVCPWCRIGKKNLMDAISEWKGEPIQIRFRAFQLDSTVPKEGRPFKEMMQKKMGSAANIDTIFERVTKAGAAVGLTFHFDRVQFMPNSRLSLQVIELAPQEKKLEILDAITKAYFEDGLDIGNIDVLLQLAEAAGLNYARLLNELELNKGDKMIDEDLRYASKIRISGVPFFIINNQFSLNGAQPSSSLLQAFNQAANPN